MLWKKESNKSDALYVDYFVDFGDELAKLDEIYEQSRPFEKFNEISIKLRDEGNAEFATQKYANAVKAYNYALCFAENGTDALSHAYANRSACFFQFDQFDESFNDNELALNASECSDELKKRINQNKRDCSDFLNCGITSKRRDHTPKLDYHPNGDFPSLADVLKIERRSDSNANFGHRIVATCDIDVNRKILVEKSPVSKLLSDKYLRCTICLKQSHNLVPCKHCTNAMFCHDGECQSSTLHEAECNLSTDIDGDGKLTFLLRTVLHAINLFGDVDELMDFVEHGNAINPNDLPLSTTKERSKYRNFTMLRPHVKIIMTKKRDPLIYFAYKAIMDSSIGQIFATPQQKRFLVHLIWQHMAIISLGYVHKYTNKKDDLESLNLSVTLSYFSHSCTPNAMFHLMGNWEIVTTMRPIKAGEEIFLSYFGKECFFGSDPKRQQHLDSLYLCFRFQCQCELCSNQMATEDDRKAMADDSCYQFILRHQNDFAKMQTNHKQLKKNAIKFLKKYGRSKWCDELADVAGCFMDTTWLENDS